MTSFLKDQVTLQNIYNSGRVMVYNYKRLYQVHYSQAQASFYALEIPAARLGKGATPYTARGRYVTRVEADL